MRFGLDVAQQRIAWPELVARAQFADALGFDGIWGFDHFQPMYGEGPGECFEGNTTLAALSGVTERVRLGLLVTGMTYRHPSVLAAEAITIDHASGGRLELSYGAAWFDREHAQLGIPFPPLKDRVDAFEEAVQIVRGLLTTDNFTFEGRHYSVTDATLRPRPVQQPHPPIWQTVSSPGSFRMAGELGMGILCTTLLSPVSVLESMVAEYDAGLAACTNPVGRFVNDQRAVFTFVFCTETVDEAIKSRAAEAALWYVNAAPKVFAVPRTVWTNLIRGNVNMGAQKRSQGAVDASKVQVDLDPDDANPIVRLMNRQVLGYDIDPVEAYEALEHQDSVIIGDVDTCLRKMQKFQAAGFGRLMGLTQFGHLGHDEVMASIRRVGEAIIPALASQPSRA